MDRNRWLILLRTVVREHAGLIATIAALVLLFSLLSDHFFTFRTLTTVANQIPDLTVVAVGMTFVLLVAGIDLSVGSVMALCGTITGLVLVDWNWPLWAAIAAAVGAGVCCGFINGAVTVVWSVPSFIVTLAMLEIARGGAYYLSHSQSVYLGARIERLAAPLPILGVSPAILVALFVVVAGQFLLSATVFGRYVLAIGGNELAARYSGVRVGRYRLATFVLLGGLTGLAGVFQVARLSASDPNAGVGFELSVIAAVVIGGTSLMGGRGSVARSFLGVVIIAVLQSGLAQTGAQELTKRIVTGLVILVAAIADVYRNRLPEGKMATLRRWFRRRKQ
jgi:ribose transport system permease protein